VEVIQEVKPVPSVIYSIIPEKNYFLIMPLDPAYPALAGRGTLRSTKTE
jgi:hypothetical protein